jgi:hypothetical protein
MPPARGIQLGFALNYGLNDSLHGARQTASCVIMHALQRLQLNIILFSGTALSNNDQPAILQFGARCREARDETIAVNGSLNEAAKSYVRAIALVTNERERSYLERRLREVESLQSQSNSYRQRPTIWISRVVRI